MNNEPDESTANQ